MTFIGEEPLLIRIEDSSYSVVMRTPGEEVCHAAGLCLGEGIVDSPQDIRSIGYDENLEPNTVDIWLTDDRRSGVSDLLLRQSYVSQTSCGICGKQMTRDLNAVLLPVPDGFETGIGSLFGGMKQLTGHQVYYPETRGTHAALIVDHHDTVLSFSEDVGRHNALDKAIGKAFLTHRLSEAGILVLSSRISYELVQKTARARIPVIVSKSRPTALAIQMARSLNMTLACLFEGSKLIIFSGGHRIKKGEFHDRSEQRARQDS